MTMFNFLLQILLLLITFPLASNSSPSPPLSSPSSSPPPLLSLSSPSPSPLLPLSLYSPGGSGVLVWCIVGVAPPPSFPLSQPPPACLCSRMNHWTGLDQLPSEMYVTVCVCYSAFVWYFAGLWNACMTKPC